VWSIKLIRIELAAGVDNFPTHLELSLARVMVNMYWHLID